MKNKVGLLLIVIIMLTLFSLPKCIVYAADDTVYLKSSEDERGYSVDLISAVHDNKTVKKIVLPENARYILSDYRYETDKGIFQNYKSLTPNCPNLSEIVVENDNPYFAVVDNILYSKDLKVLYYCPPGKTGEIVLPSQVEKIKYMTFQGCDKITSIIFSSALSDIEDAVFGNNISLVKIKITENNQHFKVESDVLFSKDGELLYMYPAGKKRTEYNVTDEVRRIVPGTFLGNQHLQKVSIPNSVTSIGIEAFRNCINLTEVQLNEGLLEIEAGAFYDCVQLKSMTFPNGIINIYQDAIRGCKKLLKITIPESVQEVPSDINEIKDRVIYCYSLYSSGWLMDKEASKATNAVVYLYKDSETEKYVKDQNVKMKYLKPKVASKKKNVKRKPNVVKGKGKPDISWYSGKKTSFLLRNPDQLAGLAELVNKGNKMSGKTFLLQNDIDLSCYESWEPIGVGMTTENKFRRFMGNFDGNGYTIFNLKVNRISDNEVGLFGITEGTIKNVIIENADVLGDSSVAILSGSLWQGRIENCKVSGIVAGRENIGGLIGSGNGEIMKCDSDIMVKGIKCAGGILGNGESTIIESTVRGEVFGYDMAGGICGGKSGEITSCKNYAIVRGSRSVGGITGEISRGSGLGNVNNSTNYASVRGIENTGGIAGFIYSSAVMEDILFNCSQSGMVIGKRFYGDMYGRKVG